MFPNRYYCPRFFTPRYWPRAGVGVVTVSQVSIGGGVVYRFVDDLDEDALIALLLLELS